MSAQTLPGPVMYVGRRQSEFRTAVVTFISKASIYGGGVFESNAAACLIA